jgi:hypothetical protein
MTRNTFSLFSSALLLAASLMASGTNSGGVNSGGGGSTSTSTCSPLSSYKVTPGYRPGGNGTIAAVWTSFSLNSCANSQYMVEIHVTNLDTGAEEYHFTSFANGDTIDDDYAQLGTNYRVDLLVKLRANGAIADSRNVTVITPGLKNG